MPRALLLLLLPLLAAQLASPAEVFVIADTANQTITIAENTKEAIAETNNVTLASNDTLTDSDTDSEDGEIVRKKRTFGDVVFRGIADVLGYNIARKPPQAYIFPPPLAPVPGIDIPLRVNTQVRVNTPLRIDEPLRIPFAVWPVLAAAPAQALAPAAAPAAPSCGTQAVSPCRAQAPPPPPPPPKPKQSPCPRPRANPRPKPRTAARPPQPPPCGQPRANPITPSPCAPPPPPPKADSNLERISSNFRLDFNFNRGLAAADSVSAEPAAEPVAEDEQVEQIQDRLVPVPIRPQAAKLPLEQPRTPRVYLDAFVVQNGVANKVHAVDARNLNRPLADDDYLVYDEQVEAQPQQNNDYEYEERTETIREFNNAVDRFWDQKQKKKTKKLPISTQTEYDYRDVHFGDRDLANQLRQHGEEQLQYSQRERPRLNRNTPLPETDEESEVTTTTQDPRRPLKPRVLPPTEHNPNQIDTITVRVPPIYKEKRPKKLHRKRPEQPDSDEYHEERAPSYREQEYSFDSDSDSDSDTDNTYQIAQTEKPKRRRRKKQRTTRSTHEEYTAGDFDYYGNKLPISNEEKFFRGLTIPPPTLDADVMRVEEARGGNGHFLDDHERLRDDRERIKEKRKNKDRNKGKEGADETERSDEKESSDEEKERENEPSAEDERADETERSDVLSPNARVRETGYQNNFVHATNVQVDDSGPLVATRVKKKKRKLKV